MNDNYKTPLISAAIEMAARTQVLADGAISLNHSPEAPGLIKAGQAMKSSVDVVLSL
jgi:hypothetical protein